MARPPRPAYRPLLLESLEGRALLSGTGMRPAAVHALVRARPVDVGQVRAGGIQTDPAGIAAVLGALNGGLGSEWVALFRSKVRNVGPVVAGFVAGRYSSYSIPGLIVKTPSVQPGFTGQFYDQLAPTAAGAAVFKQNVFELAAIMRGPFRDPNPSTYVFALNRGAGAGLGPVFGERPGITPDALVTITVGPHGTSPSGVITDLVTGSSQAISASNLKVVGSTLRVFLNTGELPSRSWALKDFQFAFWTQTQPGRDFTTVASLAPDASMIPIGVLKSAAARR